VPLEPLRLPDDFWERDDVEAALTAPKIFTALFKLLKDEDVSQTQIAVACDLSQSMVSQIQTGKHEPAHHTVRLRIADGLNMPDRARLVLFRLAQVDPQPTPGTAPATNSDPDPDADLSDSGSPLPPLTVFGHLLQEENLSQEEAAAKLGIGIRQVSRYVRKRPTDPTKVRPTTRRALQAHFGKTVHELLQTWHSEADSSPEPSTDTIIPTNPQSSVAPDVETTSVIEPQFDQGFAGLDHALTPDVRDEADPGAPSRLEDARLWLPADTINSLRRITQGDLSLNRRQAASTLASLIFGAPLLELLEPWLVSFDQPRAADRPSGIGYEEVTNIENAALLFRSWNHQFGGGLRRKAVVGLLSDVADELDYHSHPDSLKRRLFGTMALLSATAASMSWDSGNGPLAQKYYIMALRAVKESGDRAFGANVLAAMARQLLYLGRPTEALELVRLAQDGARGHATPKVYAMLHTREAWAYANQGRIEAFRRATGKAEDALTNASPDAEPPWIVYFDEAELAGVTGGRLLELAHRKRLPANQASDHIQRAIAIRQSGSLRSSALDQVGLAEARLVQGHAEEASRLGHEAIDTVAQTHSHRARVKLAELYTYTEAHAKVPSVAELRGRIRDLLPIRPGQYSEDNLA
jgi:transcriptional regulator with XRE-family HTH domain/tetratricopeptide (TPR) repeat protein